ncbi:MAG: peptidylprolyl isomerase [Xanthomonadales bacterium]|nr:peptidylprolyl isomerase [Xanthomonadales bacterium]
MLHSTFTIKNLLLTLLLCAASTVVGATTVIMKTSLGDIEIELFDDVAPGTVENFLKYVNDGDYEDSFIHRSVPGFIIQGGGFAFKNNTVVNVPTDSPITNEFNRSNLRGTISMAKLGGNPNSATSQWFINIADNTNLDGDDGQGGGFFTVFGQVIASSMNVVDAIAALNRVNAGGALGELPVRNYAGGNILRENLIFANVVLATNPPANSDCDSQFVTQNPNELVLEVSPTGTDDTDNIQCALNLAANSGIPVVRLGTAEYTISSIIATLFNGSFQGTTRAGSILHIADQSISCTSMESQGLTSSAIKFVRGEPRLRFMTIKAGNPCASGEPLKNLVHFTGLDANDSSCNNDVVFGVVDRVTITGPGRESNILSAIAVTPEAAELGGCKNTLLGTFKLNRSEISDFSTGITSSMKARAQVDVNFSTFSNNSTAISLADSNQSTTITSNVFNSENSDPAISTAYGVLVTTLSADAPSKTRVVVNSNQFTFTDSTDSPGTAITAGIFNTVIQDVSISITNNTFTLAGQELIAIHGLDVNNATVSTNKFNGVGLYGILADRNDSSGVSDWTITANTGFASFTTMSDISLGAGTNQFIIGPNQNATTDDQGSGNTIL